MNLKERYIEIAAKVIHKIDPSLNKDDVKKCISSIVKQRIKDPTIIMDNNVTGDGATINLSQLCGWIEKENPVISGNATFYMQPSILKSPTSDMLKSLKKGRKEVKKAMFKFKPGSDEYASLDLNQQNKKVIMNAEYGGSGTPTAAFYTKYSPAATTLMAQSIITTMAAFFEGYIGDNLKFFNANECFDWMIKVCEKDDPIDEWLYVPEVKEVANRIKRYFIMPDASDFESIDKFVASCSDKQLVYLYYANNFKELIGRHAYIQNIIHRVLCKLPNYEAVEKEIPPQFIDKFKDSNDPVQDYNKWISNEMFLNPYEIPEVIKDEISEFVSLMTKYIYVEYTTPDSIVKLNNHKRNTVLLVDTDSNMLNADIFVAYILNEIFPGETFGREKMYNEMILINILAASLDEGIKRILDYYGRCHNMDENSRAELTMKNEFMFKTFFLMKVKKRYAASIVLREGNIIIPFKPELKGMDFIKAGIAEDVSKRFEKMLCNHILFSETLELHELMNDLKSFEKEIYDDIHNGGITYYKQTQYKSIEGYKDAAKAWGLPVFKGSAVWNEIYPDKKIYSLDRVRVIKLAVNGLTDLECIKYKYPDEYNMIAQKIFINPNQDLKKVGMKVICIPNSVKKLPDWLIPLVDDTAIISDMISSFKSVLEALHLEDVQFSTSSGSGSLTSALISL